MGVAACKRHGGTLTHSNHPGTLIPPPGKVGPLSTAPPLRRSEVESAHIFLQLEDIVDDNSVF